MRGEVIERLMCEFGFSLADMRKRHGEPFDAVAEQAEHLVRSEHAGWCDLADGRFFVTEEGKPFTRIIASKFDAWLAKGNVRYSKAV